MDKLHFMHYETHTNIYNSLMGKQTLMTTI